MVESGKQNKNQEPVVQDQELGAKGPEAAIGDGGQQQHCNSTRSEG